MSTDTRARQAANSLAVHAKLLCSAVFVVGRNPDEYVENDLRTLAHAHDWSRCSVDIDPDAETVTLSVGGVSRTAAHNGSQGCTLLPEGESSVHFDPVPVEPSLPAPAETAWPMGDRDAAPVPEPDALATVLDRAVSDDPPDGMPPGTRAVVVVQDGDIVGERYADGFERDTRHLSWSMGKSVTAALVGILVGEGHLDVDDPAPIAAWQEDDDPRGDITVDHLLRMSSGLDCRRGGDEKDTTPGVAEDHHHRVYYHPIDVFEFATGRPLADEPGTTWRYRNCDTLALGRIVRETVEATGREYLSVPQRALYDRIGVRNAVHEPDPYGNLVTTGYNYGTARDWARFGLLHLRDGEWQGERVLPEGWVDHVTAPAPAHPENGYGGQFWLNAGGALPNVPTDAYSARGARGQLTMVVPSRNAVVVRLGHTPGHEDEQHDALVGPILDALPR